MKSKLLHSAPSGVAKTEIRGPAWTRHHFIICSVILLVFLSYQMGGTQEKKGPLSGSLINGADPKYNTPIAAMNHLTLGIDQIGNNELSGARANFLWVINEKDGAPSLGGMDLKPLAYLNLGVVDTVEKDFNSAARNFIKAIELKPNYPEAYFNLGAVHYKQGLLNQAEKAFLRAIEQQPDYGRAHYSLGFVYLDQKKYDLAKKYADKASELGVQYKTLKEKLAKVSR
jgi:tetratricopeptide (TPR) repeat protein